MKLSLTVKKRTKLKRVGIRIEVIALFYKCIMASNFLYIFDNDLRSNYLPILDDFIVKVNQDPSATLSCIYLFDPSQLKVQLFNSAYLGNHRLLFLSECLQDLGLVLANRGISFQIVLGNKASNLNKVLVDRKITDVGFSSPVGTDEINLFTLLQQSDVNLHQRFQHTLFAQHELPFDLKELPHSFSKFRKLVEALPLDSFFSQYERLTKVNDALTTSETITKQLYIQFEQSFNLFCRHPNVEVALKEATSNRRNFNSGFEGGETNVVAHLHQYFSLNCASSYKETRNFLDNWTASTKFSAALASGSLSPKYIWHEIVKYEQLNGANESTYWIKFELLWREYFQWYGARYREKLFKFSGINNKKPLNSFYAERYKKWCDANTPSAFINAIMNQLKATGYISNRSRQITASYFVNELNLDWRYGAAYFQEMLIDYDVASNWGNWQYLAGVGCDPRGKRQFNIQKQQQCYDPEGRFIKRWADKVNNTALDSVDAADWPILSDEGVS